MRNGGILLRGGLKLKVKSLKITEMNLKHEKAKEIDQLKSRNSILAPNDTNLDLSDLTASRVIDSHRPLMTPRN